MAGTGRPDFVWIIALSWCWPTRWRDSGATHPAAPRDGDEFGRGDLSARAHQKRRDEIGDLAAAFDEMAERIQTLLTAERRLLQDVSHELRSPLARLSFALELVRKNRPATRLLRGQKEWMHVAADRRSVASDARRG